jgi:hypothetical protein
MRDYFTGDNVDVRMSQKCGAYIMIEPARINSVEALLQRNGIPFMLEDPANSCVGTPEAAVIEFGRNADVEKIQRVLDGTR